MDQVTPLIPQFGLGGVLLAVIAYFLKYIGELHGRLADCQNANSASAKEQAEEARHQRDAQAAENAALRAKLDALEAARIATEAAEAQRQDDLKTLRRRYPGEAGAHLWIEKRMAELHQEEPDAPES